MLNSTYGGTEPTSLSKPLPSWSLIGDVRQSPLVAHDEHAELPGKQGRKVRHWLIQSWIQRKLLDKIKMAGSLLNRQGP